MFFRRDKIHQSTFEERIANLKQLLCFTEFQEQMRNVGDHLRVADADLLRIVTPDQILKKLLQRMRFRNHNLGSR